MTYTATDMRKMFASGKLVVLKDMLKLAQDLDADANLLAGLEKRVDFWQKRLNKLSEEA